MVDQNNDDYKICLTAGHERLILSIPPNESMKDLYQRVENHFDAKVVSIQSCIPPRITFTRADDSVVRSIVARNDRVLVLLEKKDNTDTTTTTTTTNTTTTGRVQRATAKKATESFAEIIAAQEKSTEMSNATHTKRKRTPPTTPIMARTTTHGSNTLARLPGRRLADGAAIAGRGKKKTTKTKMNNEHDVSMALFTALNQGGGGKVGRVLRGAMKNAITCTYNATYALVRVAAVQANQYTITESTTATLHVAFSKMTQGRGNYEEDVDCIPLDALKQVLEAIHQSDRESLRPVTLAQLSPRVFWSLLHQVSPECATRSIEAAYVELLPQLDWKFLNRRKTTLSDKAKENLRQQTMDDNNDEDIHAAHEAVQAVENAMDSLEAYSVDQRRKKAADAAMARINISTTTVPSDQRPWELVTPTELDEDELVTCLGNDAKNFVPKLIQHNIFNWRMLANCTSVDLSTKLNVPETTIDRWLDRAQQESIDEVMVEICDANIAAVEALCDEAKSGTPKDLSLWRSIPDMLLGATPSLKNAVDVTTLGMWCQRSYEVLQNYQWINWYATPVD